MDVDLGLLRRGLPDATGGWQKRCIGSSRFIICINTISPQSGTSVTGRTVTQTFRLEKSAQHVYGRFDRCELQLRLPTF
jgi:hypothetical protein